MDFISTAPDSIMRYHVMGTGSRGEGLVSFEDCEGASDRV